MMRIQHTDLEGVLLIEPHVHLDTRGFFMESYHYTKFKERGIDTSFVQDNHSLSVKAGTIRGLHYQLDPMAQAKLIRVLTGAIYDVVVDLRVGSPTYGKWQAFELSEKNMFQLFVPAGFAHGFCTLVDNTQVLYKVDNYYSPEHDRGIRWDDPTLGIPWPCQNPILSKKDLEHPAFHQAENNFVYRGSR